MKVLELYSGIGGMHMALKTCGIAAEIIASMEINTTANQIYKHNFPNTNLLNFNIEGLTADTINKLNIDTILMSPPCQPFTRNGLKNDVKDPRTASFVHVLSLLQDTNVKRILIENVKGFEVSEMRQILVNTLEKNGFGFQEFLLTPTSFGVPNSRMRYYCLAKKTTEKFMFQTTNTPMEQLPGFTLREECCTIANYIDNGISQNYLLPDKILKKYLNILDICYASSRRSCCFTKAYSRFIEGTGSVYSNKDPAYLKEIMEKLKHVDIDSQDYLILARSMNLRFFTPSEICKLMCFPDNFEFPGSVLDKQKYMVLGNSINVKVVGELIKLLI